MDLNAETEAMRSKFVNFDDRKELRMVDCKLKQGGADNDWPKIFAGFSLQIKENIGIENHAKLVPSFSTTTMTTQVVHELGLMNCMQHYFDYTLNTRCGISKVKLLGDLKDWEKLREMTENLSDYQLEWWTENLIEILDKFINAYKGEVDEDFWKHIYKYYSGNSGESPSINGWILNFVPYVEGERSPFALRSLKESIQHGYNGPGLEIKKLK